MKVITVRQPWAWAIVHGGKNIENRTRNIAGTYRGPVAIHAGLGISQEGMDSTLVGHALRDRGHISSPRTPFGGGIDLGAPMYRGAVIGVVDLVDVHEAVDGDAGQDLRVVCCTSPWALHGDTKAHLVLANPRPLSPIPATGRLGLWKPDPDLLAAITDQLEESR